MIFLYGSREKNILYYEKKGEIKMKKINIESSSVKKVLGIASAVVMGVVTVSNALSEQKKAQEFEDMKKTLSELQKK